MEDKSYYSSGNGRQKADINEKRKRDDEKLNLNITELETIKLDM